MKKAWAFASILFAALLILIGCFQKSGAFRPAYEPASPDNGCLELIPQDAVSREMHAAFLDNLAKCFGQAGEDRPVSSVSAQYCALGFDSWEDCEAFLGFPVPNPLEDCPWLETGTYVSMPIGYMDAPRVYLSWYMSQPWSVQRIDIQAGYRKDGLRVSLRAMLYGEPTEGDNCLIDTERLNYLEQSDGSPLVVSDSGEQYSAMSAYQAQGAVLYDLRVIGETGTEAQIEDTLEQVVEFFFPASD